MLLPRWEYQTVLSALLLLFDSGSCSKKEIKTGSMYHSSMCQEPGQKKKIQWLSEKTSAIITGKSNSDPKEQCKIIFGLASNNADARLRINFDFMYFHDCDIKLQINQSTSSNFDESNINKEMFLSGCYSKTPKVLYAQPRHYVLLSLSKNGEFEQAFNFRLNISVAETLPVTGPALHVVIIVTFVCVVLVTTAAVLLLKYAVRMSHRWSEERREQAMTRAINLYNSSEPLEEPEMVYIQPGGSASSSSNSQSGSGSGGAARGARHKQRGMEIAFVHSDGRIERFRPFDIQQSGEQTPDKSTTHAIAGTVASTTQRPKPQRSRLANSNSDRFHEPNRGPVKMLTSTDAAAVPSIRHAQQVSSNEPQNAVDYSETASIGGVDLPPSYEEALHMPLPESAEETSIKVSTNQSGHTNNHKSRAIDSRNAVYVNNDMSSRVIDPVNNPSSSITNPVNESSSRVKKGSTTAGPGRDSESQRRVEGEDLEELGPDSANYMNIGGRLELLSQDSAEGDNETARDDASASQEPLLP